MVILPEENTENDEVALATPKVTINIRNLNTGDSKEIEIEAGVEKKPVDIFHEAGWTHVGNDATILLAPLNRTLTPTVPREFVEGNTLILSNKGTVAGL